MSATPYDPQQRKTSDTVHLNNRDVLYSSLFGVKKGTIIYDDLPEDFRNDADKYIATDCILDVKFKGLRAAMRFLISYRFREARFQCKQDVTFTEWNHTPDIPSELYKMAVHYFTYGYYDLALRLIEAIIIDVPELKKAIAKKQICPSEEDIPNHRSDQSFVSYKFSDLKKLELIVRHFKEVNGILVPQPRDCNKPEEVAQEVIPEHKPPLEKPEILLLSSMVMHARTRKRKQENSDYIQEEIWTPGA